MTMHNLRIARLAIFNGLPDQVRNYVDAAVTGGGCGRGCGEGRVGYEGADSGR